MKNRVGTLLNKKDCGKDFAANDIGFSTKDLVVRRASDTLCDIATLFVANSSMNSKDV